MLPLLSNFYKVKLSTSKKKKVSTLRVLNCTTRCGFLEDLGKNETTDKIHIKTKVRVTVHYFVTGR